MKAAARLARADSSPDPIAPWHLAIAESRRGTRLRQVSIPPGWVQRHRTDARARLARERLGMAIPDLPAEEPGRYVTDGVNLFRLLTAPGSPPHGGLVELEDAGTLEHVVLRASDLSGMRHVPVAAAAR